MLRLWRRSYGNRANGDVGTSNIEGIGRSLGHRSHLLGFTAIVQLSGLDIDMNGLPLFQREISKLPFTGLELLKLILLPTKEWKSMGALSTTLARWCSIEYGNGLERLSNKKGSMRDQ